MLAVHARRLDDYPGTGLLVKRGVASEMPSYSRGGRCTCGNRSARRGRSGLPGDLTVLHQGVRRILQIPSVAQTATEMAIGLEQDGHGVDVGSSSSLAAKHWWVVSTRRRRRLVTCDVSSRSAWRALRAPASHRRAGPDQVESSMVPRSPFVRRPSRRHSPSRPRSGRASRSAARSRHGHAHHAEHIRCRGRGQKPQSGRLLAVRDGRGDE